MPKQTTKVENAPGFENIFSKIARCEDSVTETVTHKEEVLRIRICSTCEVIRSCDFTTDMSFILSQNIPGQVFFVFTYQFIFC